jgi:multidrug efflux pump subunit AcrB
MRPGLTGITVDSSLYRPASYLSSALHRLGIAVLVGLVLLSLVVGVLGRSWRVALVALAAVATSAAAALWVLYLRGETFTSMTVLALAAALALIVDDAVGDVADLRTRLGERRDPAQPVGAALLLRVATERRATLLCATLVTLLALVPLLLLSGPAGALVRPAVLTFALALLASLLVALIVTPVLTALLLTGPRSGATVGGHRAHLPAGARHGLRTLGALSDRTLARPAGAVAALVVLAVLAVPGIGLLRAGGMLPMPEDRTLIVSLRAASGTALPEMNRITSAAAAELRTLPGVRSAATQVGRAIASDRVDAVDQSEIWLTVDDGADLGATLRAVRTTARGYAGLHSEVTTYTQQRWNEATAGTGDQLVVRVYGQDFATLRTAAEQVRQEIQTVGGVLSPTVARQVTEPAIEIQVDLAAARTVGLRPGDVRRDASTLISGLTVGSLYEQQAIFDVVLWGGPATRDSVGSLQSLLLDTPSGSRVRLGDVAHVRLTAAPTVITHDAVSRSLDVTAEIRGRSAAAVAADVTTHLRRMDFPYEYRAEVVGQAVDRADSRRWIVLGAGLVLLLAYLLLQAGTASWRGAAVLLLAVPAAAVGGLAGAQLAGGVLTIGVVAALFAGVALALRQALTLVRRARVLRPTAGRPAEAMRQAVIEAAPPVVATALAVAALVLPAALMDGGAGLELLHPFAVTLLGGLITTVVVVLFVVPALYGLVAGRLQHEGEEE